MNIDLAKYNAEWLPMSALPGFAEREPEAWVIYCRRQRAPNVGIAGRLAVLEWDEPPFAWRPVGTLPTAPVREKIEVSDEMAAKLAREIRERFDICVNTTTARQVLEAALGAR